MGLFDIIKEDLGEPKRQDPAYNNWIDLVFNYPGIWALINYRIANFFYNKNFKSIARMISGITRIITAVDIHPGAKIGRRVFFDHATGIVIGETTIIGNDVLIYQGVTLGGVSTAKGKRHPNIEDGVVIGGGAKVLGNITIGENSKIGANSVVVKDIPANCTAVGIPARVIGVCENDPLAHNKIPDVYKELFEYLIKKIDILESAIEKNDPNIIKEENELDQKYKTIINSIKN